MSTISITETQLKSQFEQSFESGRFPVNAYSNSIKHLAWWVESRAQQIKDLGYPSVDRMKRRPAKIDEVTHNFLVICDLARQLGFSLREVALDPVYGASYILSKEPNVKPLDIPLSEPTAIKPISKLVAVVAKYKLKGYEKVAPRIEEFVLAQMEQNRQEPLPKNRVFISGRFVARMAHSDRKFAHRWVKEHRDLLNKHHQEYNILPEDVKSQGKYYKNDVKAFLEETPGYQKYSISLYREYLKWADRFGRCSMSSTSFREYFKEVQADNPSRIEIVQEIPKPVDPLDELNRALTCNQVVFLTGAAGTGKSTLIKEWYKNHTNDAILLGTTGIAAQNLHENCRTVHSCFLFRLSITDYDIINWHYENFSDKLNWLKRVKIIVIEEVSMLRVDLIDGVSRLLQLIHRNNKPFGGVQIILCGDMAQLPPVVKQEDEQNEYEVLMARYGGVYFFNAPPIKEVMKDKSFKRLQLTKVYRQQGDSEYLDILSRVRTGNPTRDDLDYLNSSRGKSKYSIILSPTNSKVKKLNEDHFNSLPGEPYVLQGILNDPKKLFKNLPLPLEIRVKPGMKVIVTRNDKGNTFVNGTNGIFQNVSLDRVEIEKSNGTTIFVPKFSFEEKKIAYDKKTDKLAQETVATYMQHPIIPGYALTIHRSQGQTYEYMEYHSDRYPRTHGLMYTTLSRVKSRSGLNMRDPVRMQDIYCDPSLTDYI